MADVELALINISLSATKVRVQIGVNSRYFTLKPEAHNMIPRDYELLSQTQMAAIFLCSFEIVHKLFTDAHVNIERQSIHSGLLIRVSCYRHTATGSENGLRQVFKLVHGFVYFLFLKIVQELIRKQSDSQQKPT